MTVLYINVLDELFFDFDNYLNNWFILPVLILQTIVLRKSGDLADIQRTMGLNPSSESME